MGKENECMADYGNLWDDYSIEFNSKLVDSGGDWSRLDEDEQEIAALWKLYVDINNGGFIQFFCNWGFQCLCYAMRGLKRIEDTSLYDLLDDTCCNVLDKFKNDTRLTAYWDIPEYLTDEDMERLDAADTQFYETECEHFTKMAYEYYSQTLKKMVTPVNG